MATNTTDRKLVWIVLALLAALLVLPALTMGFGLMGGPMMGGAWEHGMWGAGDAVPGWAFLVGAGLQLLFLAFLVVAGYLGYRALTSRAGATDPAISELRSAYARGELDDEEFERRRERLEANE